jgi:prophage antirepressor-like protein
MTFSFTPQAPDIRAIMDNNGKEWFVAADICEILGLGNVSMACQNLEDDEKLVSKVLISGQSREVNLISLSGVILLTSRSNKPQAKTFSKWIRNDLIPNLFKQGYYFLNRKIEIPETAEGMISLGVYLDKQETELKKQFSKIRETRKEMKSAAHIMAVPYQPPADTQIGLFS